MHLAAKNNPRLLFVVNGAEFFVSHRLPLAISAREAGFDVHIATSKPALERDVLASVAIRAAGFPFHSVRLSRSGVNPIAEMATVIDLVRLYRKLRPYIVHHVTMKPVVYGSYAAACAKVPAIVNAVSGLGYAFLDRSLTGLARRRVLKSLLRQSLKGPRVRVIFQNDDDAGLFLRNGLVSQQQVRLIRGSGVDTHVFVPAQPPSGLPVVLLPGRMLRDKGVIEFVTAARSMKKRGIAARFALVGDVDENRAGISESTLYHWDKEGAVEWWGHRMDMVAVMQGATVVVLPSYREGLPKVLLEAAACAKPVVTTDVPGCRDAIEPDRTGLLVPVRDATRLASAVRRILGNRQMQHSFGQAGRRMVLDRFSVDAICKQTLRVYNELIDADPCGSG